MTSEVGMGWVARHAFWAVMLGGTMVVSRVQAAPIEIFSTGFEQPDYKTEENGERLTLAGQEEWLANAAGGNQVFEGYFPGLGQHGLVGFTPPDEDVSSVSVWRPLNYDPVADGNPVVTFTAVISITDSTDPALRDSFQWSVYNTNAEPDRLFTLDFDNATTNIAYLLDDDDAGFVLTSFYFERQALDDEETIYYELTITMDFEANHWSAFLFDQIVVDREPLTTTGAALHLGDIDTAWVRAPGNTEFGDNYMVFDNYRVVAAPAPAPRMTLVERRADGTVVIRVDGEEGLEFALEVSNDLEAWATLITATIPTAGQVTFEDSASLDEANRFYRSRLIP